LGPPIVHERDAVHIRLGPKLQFPQEELVNQIPQAIDLPSITMAINCRYSASDRENLSPVEPPIASTPRPSTIPFSIMNRVLSRRASTSISVADLKGVT